MTNTTVTIDRSFSTVFDEATAAVCKVARDERWTVEPNRYWFVQLTREFNLHPVVRAIVDQGVRPIDWQQLLLEWPHVSVDDEQQIAYTRNEEAGRSFTTEGSKRLTRTPIGKYLSRHWPHVPDHVRRDWQGSFGQHKYEIWDTKEMIISGIELGPQSCMKSSYGNVPFSNRDNSALVAWQHDKTQAVRWDRHPYAVYAPELGWRMAVRLDPGKPDIVMGRCLVNVEDNTFVRSYKRGDSDGSYSHTDERLEAWLVKQGFSKADGWEGHKTLRLEHPDDGIMMPYLDGCTQRADTYDRMYMVITEYGEYECDNTDGHAGDSREACGECEDCGDTVYEDDENRIWVGRNEETLIGGCCAGGYTYVRGAILGFSRRFRNYSEYYVNSDDAVYVDGNDYDADNPPDEIVYCEDGEWRLREDCRECEDGEWYPSDECIEIDGVWYHQDSDDIVECKDGRWRVKSDCWESSEGNWYSDSEPPIEVSEGTYHPSELQAKIDAA